MTLRNVFMVFVLGLGCAFLERGEDGMQGVQSLTDLITPQAKGIVCGIVYQMSGGEGLFWA